MVRRVFAFSFVVLAAGCPESAKEDLREAADAVERAGEKLGDAAVKTNEVVEEKLEIAAERAGDVAEAAKDMADPEAEKRAADAVSCKGDKCTISQSEFDKLMSNPLLVASQLSVSSTGNAGHTRWRIDEVKDGSACERLGLQAGDIVLRVNGEALGNPPPDSLLDDLRQADKVVLELDRDGSKVRREIRRKPG